MKSNRSFCSFLTDFKHKEVKSMYKPIDASTLVLFRKRISAEMLIEANEYLLDHKDDDKDELLWYDWSRCKSWKLQISLNQQTLTN